ncbi:hypothetical protein ACFCVY_16610 [Streptomyces sp. NPDC056411]|uniref:hypothetical protein n=1 Tax=Streptomyces sp. NPDC056411 TaxID=3345813 RepID=UPI0035D5F1A7
MSVLTTTGPTGAWAWAGLRLEPEPALAENGAHLGLPEAQRRLEAATLEQVWLSQQWRPDGRAVELRYATAPGGGVSCTLLCRAHAAGGPAASAAALALRDALAHTPRHVRAEPIEDAGALHTALVPFAGPPAGLVEVRRRLSWAWLQRRDTDFPLGVAVDPLRAEAVSWEPVWEALARATAPTVVGICLEPYAPPQELLGYLRYLAQEYGRLAQPGAPSPVFGQYIAPDPFAVRAAARYHEALAAAAGRGYRMRISLAAAGAAPLPLAELIAATVAPPAAEGGGAVARAVPPHETAAAWAGFTGLQLPWLDATYRQEVPQPLGGWEQILADLVDVPQASAAFRFPYEIPGRPPLFRTAGRSGPDPEAAAPAPAEGRDPHAPSF